MGVVAGRGSALLVVLAGLGVVAVAGAAWSFPAVRNIERHVPDVVVEVDAPVEVAARESGVARDVPAET